MWPARSVERTSRISSAGDIDSSAAEPCRLASSTPAVRRGSRGTRGPRPRPHRVFPAEGPECDSHGEAQVARSGQGHGRPLEKEDFDEALAITE